MSQQEPTEAYVYQAEAVNRGDRIYAVGGPGTEEFKGLRFTEFEAHQIVFAIMCTKKVNQHLKELVKIMKERNRQ